MGLDHRAPGVFSRSSAAVRSVLPRMLVSGAAAATLGGLADLGLGLSTQSKLVNLLFEPLSLLFLPGIAIGIAWTTIVGHLQKHPRTLADNHDFSPTFVFWCTIAFYFALTYWFLQRRRHRAALTAQATSA